MLATEVKEMIWSDLENRYMQTEVSEILNLDSFLDPRFKEQHLHDREDIIQQITDQCLQYYLIVNKENESSTTSSTPEVEEVNPAKRLKGLAAVLQHIAEENDDVQTGAPLTPLQKIKKEITSYLEYPLWNQTPIPLNGGN